MLDCPAIVFEIVAIPAKPLQIRKNIVLSVPIYVVHYQNTFITYTTFRAFCHYSRPFYDVPIGAFAEFPAAMLFTYDEMLILPDGEAAF